MTKSDPPIELPKSDLYIVCSMSNAPYQQWQSDLLDFSVREVGQRGAIVRICSQDNHLPNRPPAKSSWGYAFVTPSYAEIEESYFRRIVKWSKRLLGRGVSQKNTILLLEQTF